MFCNGFEEALPWTPTPWDYKDGPSSDGSYAPSTTTKYYGVASGHFTTTGASRATRSQVAYQGQLNGKNSGDLWLRYYYYLPSSVTINSSLSVSSMSESTGNFQGCSLAIYPGYATIENGFSLTSTQSAQPFPRDQWVCLEQHVFIDSTNGIVELYMNGSTQPVISTTTGNTVPSGGYGVVEVGINGVGTGQGQVDVYVDNVVISTSRYGCD